MNHVKTSSATTKPLTHPIIVPAVDQSVDPQTKLRTAHAPNQSAKQKHISNSTIQPISNVTTGQPTNRSAKPNLQNANSIANHLVATSNQTKPLNQPNHVAAGGNSLGGQSGNNTEGKTIQHISQQKNPTSNSPKQAEHTATQLKNIDTHFLNSNIIPQTTNHELQSIPRQPTIQAVHLTTEPNIQPILIKPYPRQNVIYFIQLCQIHPRIQATIQPISPPNQFILQSIQLKKCYQECESQPIKEQNIHFLIENIIHLSGLNRGSFIKGALFEV